MQLVLYCTRLYLLIVTAVALNSQSLADSPQNFITGDDPHQLDVLAHLFNSTSGPSWIIFSTNSSSSSWSPVPWLQTEISYCRWAGVTCCTNNPLPFVECNNSHDIVALNLEGFGLDGSIPSALSTLPGLRALNLADNPNLLGAVPAVSSLLWLSVVNTSLVACEGGRPSQLPATQCVPTSNMELADATWTLGTVQCPVVYLNSFREFTQGMPPTLANLVTSPYPQPIQPGAVISTAGFINMYQCKCTGTGVAPTVTPTLGMTCTGGSSSKKNTKWIVAVVIVAIVPQLLVALGIFVFIKYKARLHALIRFKEEQMQRKRGKVPGTPGMALASGRGVLAMSDVTVTWVCTDVASSTLLWEWNPNCMDKAIDLHNRELRAIMDEFAGHEIRNEGDSFVMSFHDALDGVKFCLKAQERLASLEWPDELCEHHAAHIVTVGDLLPEERNKGEGPAVIAGLRVRMGINTGIPDDVFLHDLTEHVDYRGLEYDLAGEICDLAAGGQIIMGPKTFQRWNKSAPDVLPDQLGFNHLDTGSAAWKDISQSFVAAQGAMRRAAGLSFPSFRHTLSWARRTATGNDGHGSPFRGPDSLTNQLSRSSPDGLHASHHAASSLRYQPTHTRSLGRIVTQGYTEDKASYSTSDVAISLHPQDPSLPHLPPHDTQPPAADNLVRHTSPILSSKSVSFKYPLPGPPTNLGLWERSSGGVPPTVRRSGGRNTSLGGTGSNRGSSNVPTLAGSMGGGPAAGASMSEAGLPLRTSGGMGAPGVMSRFFRSGSLKADLPLHDLHVSIQMGAVAAAPTQQDAAGLMNSVMQARSSEPLAAGSGRGGAGVEQPGQSKPAALRHEHLQRLYASERPLNVRQIEEAVADTGSSSAPHTTPPQSHYGLYSQLAGMGSSKFNSATHEDMLGGGTLSPDPRNSRQPPNSEERGTGERGAACLDPLFSDPAQVMRTPSARIQNRVSSIGTIESGDAVWRLRALGSSLASALHDLCSKCLACMHLVTIGGLDEEQLWDADPTRRGGSALRLASVASRDECAASKGVIIDMGYYEWRPSGILAQQDEQQPRPLEKSFVHLVQVVPTAYAARALLFDWPLPLNPDRWDKVSPGFFDAPGSERLIFPSMRELMTGSELAAHRPGVAVAFSSVEGFREICAVSLDVGRDMLTLHNACVRETLSTCGGYECKEFNGSFMTAFKDACGAMEWALTLQMALMHVGWASELLAAHDLSAAVYDDEMHTLIYRGFRSHVGIYSGPIDRVIPHVKTGRADYFGQPVNRAARLMSAARGGQIVCERRLMEQVAEEWSRRFGAERKLEPAALQLSQLSGQTPGTPHAMHVKRLASMLAGSRTPSQGDNSFVSTASPMHASPAPARAASESPHSKLRGPTLSSIAPAGGLPRGTQSYTQASNTDHSLALPKDVRLARSFISGASFTKMRLRSTLGMSSGGGSFTAAHLNHSMTTADGDSGKNTPHTAASERRSGDSGIGRSLSSHLNQTDHLNHQVSHPGGSSTPPVRSKLSVTSIQPLEFEGGDTPQGVLPASGLLVAGNIVAPASVQPAAWDPLSRLRGAIIARTHRVSNSSSASVATPTGPHRSGSNPSLRSTWSNVHSGHVPSASHLRVGPGSHTPQRPPSAEPQGSPSSSRTTPNAMRGNQSVGGSLLALVRQGSGSDRGSHAAPVHTSSGLSNRSGLLSPLGGPLSSGLNVSISRQASEPGLFFDRHMMSSHSGASTMIHAPSRLSIPGFAANKVGVQALLEEAEQRMGGGAGASAMPQGQGRITTSLDDHLQGASLGASPQARGRSSFDVPGNAGRHSDSTRTSHRTTFSRAAPTPGGARTLNRDANSSLNSIRRTSINTPTTNPRTLSRTHSRNSASGLYSTKSNPLTTRSSMAPTTSGSMAPAASGSMPAQLNPTLEPFTNTGAADPLGSPKVGWSVQAGGTGGLEAANSDQNAGAPTGVARQAVPNDPRTFVVERVAAASEPSDPGTSPTGLLPESLRVVLAAPEQAARPPFDSHQSTLSSGSGSVLIPHTAPRLQPAASRGGGGGGSSGRLWGRPRSASDQDCLSQSKVEGGGEDCVAAAAALVSRSERSSPGQLQRNTVTALNTVKSGGDLPIPRLTAAMPEDPLMPDPSRRGSRRARGPLSSTSPRIERIERRSSSVLGARGPLSKSGTHGSSMGGTPPGSTTPIASQPCATPSVHHTSSSYMLPSSGTTPSGSGGASVQQQQQQQQQGGVRGRAALFIVGSDDHPMVLRYTPSWHRIHSSNGSHAQSLIPQGSVASSANHCSGPKAGLTGAAPHGPGGDELSQLQESSVDMSVLRAQGSAQIVRLQRMQSTRLSAASNTAMATSPNALSGGVAGDGCMAGAGAGAGGMGALLGSLDPVRGTLHEEGAHGTITSTPKSTTAAGATGVHVVHKLEGGRHPRSLRNISMPVPSGSGTPRGGGGPATGATGTGGDLQLSSYPSGGGGSDPAHTVRAECFKITPQGQASTSDGPIGAAIAGSGSITMIKYTNMKEAAARGEIEEEALSPLDEDEPLLPTNATIIPTVPVEIAVWSLGSYRLKGVTELMRVVQVVPVSLERRMYPLTHGALNKGKARCIHRQVERLERITIPLPDVTHLSCCNIEFGDEAPPGAALQPDFNHSSLMNALASQGGATQASVIGLADAPAPAVGPVVQAPSSAPALVPPTARPSPLMQPAGPIPLHLLLMQHHEEAVAQGLAAPGSLSVPQALLTAPGALGPHAGPSLRTAAMQRLSRGGASAAARAELESDSGLAPISEAMTLAATSASSVLLPAGIVSVPMSGALQPVFHRPVSQGVATHSGQLPPRIALHRPPSLLIPPDAGPHSGRRSRSGAQHIDDRGAPIAQSQHANVASLTTIAPSANPADAVDSSATAAHRAKASQSEIQPLTDEQGSDDEQGTGPSMGSRGGIGVDLPPLAAIAFLTEIQAHQPTRSTSHITPGSSSHLPASSRSTVSISRILGLASASESLRSSAAAHGVAGLVPTPTAPGGQLEGGSHATAGGQSGAESGPTMSSTFTAGTSHHSLGAARGGGRGRQTTPSLTPSPTVVIQNSRLGRRVRTEGELHRQLDAADKHGEEAWVPGEGEPSGEPSGAPNPGNTELLAIARESQARAAAAALMAGVNTGQRPKKNVISPEPKQQTGALPAPVQSEQRHQELQADASGIRVAGNPDQQHPHALGAEYGGAPAGHSGQNTLDRTKGISEPAVQASEAASSCTESPLGGSTNVSMLQLLSSDRQEGAPRAAEMDTNMLGETSTGHPGTVVPFVRDSILLNSSNVVSISGAGMVAGPSSSPAQQGQAPRGGGDQAYTTSPSIDFSINGNDEHASASELLQFMAPNK